MDEHGKYNGKLMTAELPFISREQCFNAVPHEFQAFITFDKFCAGSENGNKNQFGSILPKYIAN